MEPRRVLLTERVVLNDGQELPQWSYAWKLAEEAAGMIRIEHRDREFLIPAARAVATPVPAPSRDRLAAALDPCFADLQRNLQVVYRHDTFLFSVFRCPHHNHFLEDIRGGIALYSLWIFLGRIDDPGENNLVRLWAKFHRMPADALHHLGIAL